MKNKKRLKHANKATAQKWADDAHQYLIDTNPRYAASVKAGQTLRWDMPKQLKDEDGKIIDSDWHIHITDDCVDSLDSTTQKLLKDV